MSPVPLHRAALLLGAAAMAWAPLAAVTLPHLELAARGEVRHATEWVTALAAGSALVTSTWLGVVLFVEVLAVTGVRRARRSWALPAQAGVAAGVTLILGATASTAVADHGLPAPERATSRTHGPLTASTHPAASRPVTEVVVRPGDSLWRIATERLLPGRPRTPEIQHTVDRLYATNRAAIGPDPDHIQPGTRLRVPRPHREELT
jgi:nucleoid-associated protein YgaU